MPDQPKPRAPYDGMSWRSRRHQDYVVWGLVIFPYFLSQFLGWFETNRTYKILGFIAYMLTIYGISKMDPASARP